MADNRDKDGTMIRIIYFDNEDHVVPKKDATRAVVSEVKNGEEVLVTYCRVKRKK